MSVVVSVLVCQHISRCYDVLTVGYSCRKGLERKVGEMGGEVEHREDPPTFGDFRAGEPLPGPAYPREHICRETQPGSLYPSSYRPAVAFKRRGRGALCDCRCAALSF